MQIFRCMLLIHFNTRFLGQNVISFFVYDEMHKIDTDIAVMYQLYKKKHSIVEKTQPLL